ncbi:MAG: hypothetical protein N2C14_01830 [Planctomycetales bacterium]
MDNSLPKSIVDQFSRIGSEFQSAWENDESPRIESWLEKIDASGRGPLLKLLLESEFRIRRNRGETPNLEEYQERFPEEAEMIAALITRAPEETVSYSEARLSPQTVSSPARRLKAQGL